MHRNVLILKGCNVAYNSIRCCGKISDEGNKKKILKRYVLSCLKRNLALLALELIQANRKGLSLFDEGCRKPHVTRQQNFKHDGRIKSKPYSYSGLDWEARSLYCRWFQESAVSGYLELELLLFTDEEWFTWNGNMNSQNNRLGCSENLHVVCMTWKIWESYMFSVRVKSYCPCFYKNPQALPVRSFLQRINRRRKSVVLLFAGKCYDPHNKLFCGCPLRGIRRVVDYGFGDLQIWTHAIVVCGGHWNVVFL